MNINEKTIPDPETRARNVARWSEVCLMFDELNMMLEQAQAIAEADLQNSPLYANRRARARKQLELHREQYADLLNYK